MSLQPKDPPVAAGKTESEGPEQAGAAVLPVGCETRGDSGQVSEPLPGPRMEQENQQGVGAVEAKARASDPMRAQPLAPDELSAWLRLVGTPQLGPIRIRRLLERFGLPVDVLRAKPSQLERVLGQTLAEEVLAPSTTAFRREVEHVARWLEVPHHHLLVLGDPAYPPALLESPDPPPMLYVSGRLELLHPGGEGQPGVAVVGSRSATHAGRTQAQRFATALGDAGVRVVSGLAMGIDAVAHSSALDTAGGTVAVVGTGVDRVYPLENRELGERIAVEGAVVSEWPLGTPPRPAHFPRRNRVIAALSAGVLVVEATPHSGSLITAQLAIDYGRDVYAIPGSIEAPCKRGCNRLIREGAMLVESPNDLLALLGLICPEAEARSVRQRHASTLASAPAAQVADSQTPAPGLSATAANGSVLGQVPDPQALGVLAALGHDPAPLDVLVARTGLSGAQVQAAVLALELNGQVEWLAGGQVARIVS
ncbi:DNA processing protein [Pararobbsia alpina]|uniref:DNA-processing protein DprA n=1 Tax=Pararobbsia alpina TaxID=621374 RepID=UPI0039A57855